MEIIRGFEHVLKREKVTSTYKYALLTSIMDYVIENPAELPKNGMHYIPLIYLAKRFFYYYYPTTFPEIIKQGTPKRSKIQSAIKDNLPMGTQEHIVQFRELIEAGETLDEGIVKTLIGIRWVIVDKPLQYIKVSSNQNVVEEIGKGNKVKEEKFTLFGLINTELEIPQDYEEARKKSLRWKGTKKEQTYSHLLSEETAFIVIGAYTFREITKYRFFLRDAILKTWIEKTRELLKNDYSALNNFIYGISLIDKEPQRNSVLIQQFSRVLTSQISNLECIYCETKLNPENLEIDHFIPWSKLPINRFWNLYPSCKACNGKKSDKIIELNPHLNEKMQVFLTFWINLFKADEKIRERFAIGEAPQLLTPQGATIYLQRIQEILENLL